MSQERHDDKADAARELLGSLTHYSIGKHTDDDIAALLRFAPSAVACSEPLYEVDGFLRKLCDCPTDKGECQFGRTRTLMTTGFSRCLVPAQIPKKHLAVAIETVQAVSAPRSATLRRSDERRCDDKHECVDRDQCEEAGECLWAMGVLHRSDRSSAKP